MKWWKWWKKDESDSQPNEGGSKLLEDYQDFEEINEQAALDAQNTINMGYRSVFQHIGWEDFKAVNEIPCFRQAILTGAAMGAVTGLVMYAVRRNGSKAVNWSFVGFLGGSVVSWEQCRFRVYQGKRNIQGAKEMYRRSKEAKNAEQRKNDGPP